MLQQVLLVHLPSPHLTSAAAATELAWLRRRASVRRCCDSKSCLSADHVAEGCGGAAGALARGGVL